MKILLMKQTAMAVSQTVSLPREGTSVGGSVGGLVGDSVGGSVGGCVAVLKDLLIQTLSRQQIFEMKLTWIGLRVLS